MEKHGDDESTLVDSRSGKSPYIAYASVRQNEEIRRDHAAETSCADVNGGKKTVVHRSKQQEAEYGSGEQHLPEYRANGAEHFGVASPCELGSSVSAAPKGFFYSQDSLRVRIAIGVFGVAMLALILYAMAAAGNYLEYKESGVDAGNGSFNAT